MKLRPTPLYLAIMFALPTATWADETDTALTLETITITAPTVDKKTFTKAGATTSVDAEKIAQTAGGLDSVVRALPGSYTFMDTRQGTLQVNVRGATGLGRVNTMIDGVPQTAFGTTATNENGGGFHDGESPTTSSFGVSIDPNFLVGLDVNRGGQGGSHGINALMGSANLRTLDVDDIISEDKDWGVRGKYAYGDNKLGHNAMLAGAYRGNLGKGEFGAMLAVSGKNTSTDYKRGDGKLASSNLYAIASTQQPRSHLAKAYYEQDAHRTAVSTRDYSTNIGGRKLGNTAHSLEYAFSPDSRLVHINALASRTKNTQDFNSNAKYFLLDKLSSKNTSDYFDINNTSYFGNHEVQLSSKNGVSYQHNNYQRQANGVDQDNIDHTTFSPTGTQKILSLYTTNTLKKDIYEAELSLTGVRTQFEGHKPACGQVSGVAVPCFPKGEATLSNKHNHLNGKIALSAKPTDYFSPFVSYAHTSRMPNIQEVFFNNEAGGSMNPHLKPETANTYEIGFNTFTHGLLTDTDTLGIKALYFKSNIKDYIHSQSFYLRTDTGTLTNDINEPTSSDFHAQISINSPNTVTSKGYEVQASYDTGKHFANLSYTHSTSNQPMSINAGHHDFGFTGGAMDKLPEDYWTLSLGTRLLDNKLQVGTNLKSFGKNVRLHPDYLDFEGTARFEQMPNAPIVADLFAHYQHSKNLSLRFGVENALDKLYINPSHAYNSNYSQSDSEGNTSFSNYARGRTWTVGVEFLF